MIDLLGAALRGALVGGALTAALCALIVLATITAIRWDTRHHRKRNRP